MGMFGAMSVLPLYLQIVKGASPTEAGLLLLPLVLGIMMSSVLSGQLTARTGRYKIFPVVGTLLMVCGLVAAEHHQRGHPVAGAPTSGCSSSVSASVAACRRW